MEARSERPDTLKSLAFMVRDSKRYAQTGGWAWAQFTYEAGSNVLRYPRPYFASS
jgi:hypothetical protein